MKSYGQNNLFIVKNYYTYPETSRKFFNVLLENLMRMEHFEIYILNLIKKLSGKLIFQLNWNYASLYFYGVEYTIEKP